MLDRASVRNLDLEFAHRRKQVILDSVLILFLGIIPFLGTGIDGLIQPIDAWFPPYPQDFFSHLLYAWYPYVRFGTDASIAFLPSIPYYAPIAFLSFIGLPASLVQRIWSVFVFSLQGWSMYYLASILPTGRNSRVARLISAFFYMYNPMVIALMRAGGVEPLVFVYATAPLILGLFIEGVEHETHALNKYVPLIVLTSLTQVVANIQVTINQMILPILYLIFYLLLRRSKGALFHDIKFTLVIGAGFFLVNLWWILPALSSFNWIYNIQYANLNFPRSLSQSSFSTFFNIGRLWLESWPFESYHLSTLGIMIGLFFAVLVYSALLLRSKDRYVLFFAASALVFTFLSRGNQPPLGEVYSWLMFNLPFGVAIFPYDPGKFTQMLSLPYAILLGITTSELFNRIQRFEKKLPRNRLQQKGFYHIVSHTPFSRIFAVAIILLILINSWPLLTGNVSGLIAPVDIPPNYASAREWLSAQPEDFRIFILPSPHWWTYTQYKWSPYAMADITSQIFLKPSVYDLPTGTINRVDIAKFADSSIYEGRSRYIGKILGLMNVKYALLRSDVDPSYARASTIDYSYLETALQQQEGMHLEKKFGDLSFYKNEYVAPRIFATSNLFSILGDINILIPLSRIEQLELNSSSLFFLDQFDADQREKLLQMSDLLVVSNETIWESYAEAIKQTGVKTVHLLSSFEKVFILKEGFYVFAVPSDMLSLLQEMQGQRLTVDSELVLEISYMADSESYFGPFYLSEGYHTLNFGTNTTDSIMNFNGYNGIQLELDFETRVQGMASVRGKIVDPTATDYSIAFNLPPSLRDLSAEKQLRLLMRLDNSKNITLGMQIYDSFGNWRNWALSVPEENTWANLKVDLRKGTGQSTTPPDLAHVERIILKIAFKSAKTGTFNVWINDLSSEDVDARFLLYPTSSAMQMTIRDVFAKSNSTSASTFQKINPSFYEVQVQTDDPIFLVFSEAYHPQWKAYVGDKELEHFPVNFDANAYYLGETKEGTVRIVFESERMFHIGAYVSAITFVACILYLKSDMWRSRFYGKIWKIARKRRHGD